MKILIDIQGNYSGIKGRPLKEYYTETPLTDNFLKPKLNSFVFDSQDNYLAIGGHWIEGASSEELYEFNLKNDLEYIKNQYEQRKLDGWDAYQQFRAEMVVKIDKGLITETQAMIIETYLGIGYDKIAQNGDWKTAYYLLSQVTVQEVHSFVQDYLIKALEIIGQYITDNYKVRENQKPSK